MRCFAPPRMLVVIQTEMTQDRTVYQLVLQLRPWGARQFGDLMRLEDQVSELLEGDAEVDGHDLGSNEANIFIFCSDPPSLLPRYVAAALDAISPMREMIGRAGRDPRGWSLRVEAP
jgi:hypothetical protein